MKHLPLLILVLVSLTSCSTNPDYRAILQFPEVDYSNITNVYCGEKTELEAGDNIIVYGGTNGFLKNHFKCDTCLGKIESRFYSKPNGSIAFVQFKDNPSQTVPYSISLYYWDRNRGYNVAVLEGWERKMTDQERDSIPTEFGIPFERHRVDNGIYFKKAN